MASPIFVTDGNGVPVGVSQECFSTASDIVGTTPLAEQPIWKNRRSVSVSFQVVAFHPRSTIAGNDSNNFTCTIRKRNSAGGVPATIVAYTNNVASGGLAAHVEKDFGAVAFTLAPGDGVTIEVTKLGPAGMTFPAGTLYFTWSSV